MAFLAKTESFSSHNLLHLSFICIVVFGSTITGNILPKALQSDIASVSFSLPSRRQNVSHASRISQVSLQEIRKQKAPQQVVLPASDTAHNEWGVAKQVDEKTWSMKVKSDQSVGTAQEILQALNAYRKRHGVGELLWDTTLGNFAQGRSDGFLKNGSMDGHAGFTDYINNKDGFHKLGFMALGENSSFGYHLEAVHLIEWVYAGDAPHDNNQLNSQWTHAGIGVSGEATDLIFGGRKM